MYACVRFVFNCAHFNNSKIKKKRDKPIQIPQKFLAFTFTHAFRSKWKMKKKHTQTHTHTKEMQNYAKSQFIFVVCVCVFFYVTTNAHSFEKIKGKSINSNWLTKGHFLFFEVNLCGFCSVGICNMSLAYNQNNNTYNEKNKTIKIKKWKKYKKYKKLQMCYVANNKYIGGDRTMFGLMTYNEEIHVYDFGNCNNKNDDNENKKKLPNMIVHTDFDDVLLPIPSDNRLLVNLKENRDSIEYLLNNLLNMHNKNMKSKENILGTAIEISGDIMKNIGGKCIVFSYGLASLGIGKVRNRENDRQFKDSGNEYAKLYHLLLKRDHNYFMDLAVNLTKYQINIDLFQFSDGEYIDLATIKAITRCGGGQLR